MAKFNTIEQVEEAFQLRSQGADRIKQHETRFSDIRRYAPVVEDLLASDYNQIHGFSFSELMEGISLIATNYGSDEYYRHTKNDPQAITCSEADMKATDGEFNFWGVCEALNPTTTAQAPYPVPSLALAEYQYTKSVLPYFCHQFDLNGNRGLVYFQRLNAANSKGNITDKDLLGSPKEMSKQPLGFAGTKNVDREEVATLSSGVATFTYTFKEKPIQPGSMIITIEGVKGYFKDYAQAGGADTVQLVSVEGTLGTATLTYSTGALSVTLATAPTKSGDKVYATYAREIENVDGGKANIAQAVMTLDSKTLDAEDFSIITETSIFQEALSKAVFGRDWNEMADQMLAALYNKEVANKVITEIKNAIPAGSVKTHSINKTSGGNNDLFNVQFISVVLGALGKLITEASGIGGNRLAAIAVNIDVLPILKALPKFTAANNDFEEVMGGMYLAGTYDGMPVIVGFDPILTSGEVVGIYKSSKTDFLAPYAWGTFILPIIRNVFVPDNQAVNRKQLISSAAGTVVAENLAAKITITDIESIMPA